MTIRKNLKKEIFNNNAGFTLLEVLIAVVILSIGLMGTAGFLTQVIRSDKLSNEMSTAVVLAQAKMEDLFQAGYLETLEKVDNPLPPEDYGDIFGYPDFKRTTTISDTGTPGALGVSIRVDYKAFGEHEFTARTILSRDIK